MARGGILGVEELGPDKYRATLANGSTPIITGDAGRRAFEDFQRSQSAVGPNALAEAPRERKGTTVTDVPRGGQAEVPPAPGGEGAQPSGMVPGGFAQDLAERPPAPPPKPAGPTRLPYAAEGIDPATGQKVVGQAVMGADGSMQIFRPGSPGSKGGITKLGQGILDAREATNAAAAPLEQQAADARQRGVELAIQQNETDLAFKEKQRQDLLLQQQNEQDEVAAAEAHALDLQAKADKAAEDFANSRAPEQSTGQSILSTIGSAMGAFGAAIGKTPNFAGEFIQQLANNRMRKWEAETNIKGKRADNMLSRYKDALGDMKIAKAAVKATLLQQAAIEAEQSALSTKSEEIGNTWRAMSAAAQAAAVRAANEKDEAFKLSFYKDKMLNAPSVAGRAAGFVPATQAAYGERQDQQGNVVELDIKRRAAEKAEQEAKAGGKVPDAVKKSVAEIDAAVQGIKNLEANDKAGDVSFLSPREGAFADPTVSGLNAAASAIGPGVARAIEGDAATKDSMDRAIGGLTARNAEQRKQARAEYLRQLETKKRAILESQ